MDLNLTGRVAVVTGASKGIGLAVVHTLVAEGARVVAASRTPPPAPDGVWHVAADLTDPRAPAEVLARAVERHGRVDLLVNNAGGPVPGHDLPHAGFLTRDDEDWRAIVDFNLLAVVRMCRAALPLLVESGGTIVNVSSANARQPSPVNVEYSAAKAALTNLSQALSEEFAPQGVRVNTVSPGPVVTPWWTDPGGAAERFGAMVGTDAETVMAQVVTDALSTGRMVQAQEVADAVAFLASPRSASTTGADLVVDGGLLKAA